jgi:2'-5' RNA ligase
MRLFIALQLPAAVRERLAEEAARLRRRLPPARWVPAANLHLTLVFLGETGPRLVPDLQRALTDCFRVRPPFRLRLADGGCFPPRRPARVAWVGFEPEPALSDLQAAVVMAVRSSIAVEPELRPFHPHLTLARPRRPWSRSAVELWCRAFAGPQGPAFEVTAGHLMRSHLGPGGARHESVGAHPLEGAGGAPV